MHIKTNVRDKNKETEKQGGKYEIFKYMAIFLEKWHGVAQGHLIQLLANYQVTPYIKDVTKTASFSRIVIQSPDNLKKSYVQTTYSDEFHIVVQWY